MKGHKKFVTQSHKELHPAFKKKDVFLLTAIQMNLEGLMLFFNMSREKGKHHIRSLTCRINFKMSNS